MKGMTNTVVAALRKSAAIAVTGIALNGTQAATWDIAAPVNKVNEGPAGTSTTLVFQATLSEADTSEASVSFATQNGTGVAGVNYLATNGVITLAAGETEAQLPVTVLGSDARTGDKTVLMTLSDPVPDSHTIGTASAVGVIAEYDAPLSTPGDSVAAKIFSGSVLEASDGNPNTDGQGWYRKDLATPLNYYTNSGGKWATSTNISAYSYSEVASVAEGKLKVKDNYSGGVGVGWVYSNCVVGTYILSCTNLTLGSYMRAEFVVRTNSITAWTSLSGVLSTSLTTGRSYTNCLGAGGGVALKIWNSCSMVANSSATVSDLKVTFVEAATNEPTVSLSLSSAQIPENPLQGDAWITAQLDQMSVSNVTVCLSFTGSAVKDSDYSVGTDCLFIAAGYLSQSTRIQAIDNVSVSGNRTVDLSIGSVLNGKDGLSAPLQATIVDDEKAPTDKGDVLWASIFLGGETNSSVANPNLSGQGWYRKDLSTPLLYYTDVTSRWATAAVKPTGSSSYSEVRPLSSDKLQMIDKYSGSLGIGWVFTSQTSGRYVLSCTNLYGNSYFVSQIVTRGGSNTTWDALSGVVTGSVAQGFAYTNWLERGGQVAFKAWVSNRLAADASGTTSSLKVALIEVHPKGTIVFLK